MEIDTAQLHAARLIPITGIGGADEQEQRATSALLSVMSVVDEFRVALTRRLDAPTGAVESYIEVPFEFDGKTLRPDGLLTVRGRGREWSALVEVKTGKAELRRDQIEAYLDIARQYGIDAVLTISNQLASDDGTHPVPVDGRKTRSVRLHHLSWVEILTEAVIQHEHRGVSDPEQAWILGELIRYLEHPNSGALTATDMGREWVRVRDGARDGTLTPGDEGVDEVVRRWDEFVYYLCLDLGRELGVNVQRVLSRKDRADTKARRSRALRNLIDVGKLAGTIRIPDTVGDVALVAMLTSRQISAATQVAAPAEGRPTTRVNWLLRQLGEAPADLRVDIRFEGTRATTSNLLGAIRENVQLALVDGNRVAPRLFELTMTRDMGVRRGTDAGSFVTSLSQLTHQFYEQIVQNLQEWSASAPRKRPVAAMPQHSEEKSSPLAAWLARVKAGDA